MNNNAPIDELLLDLARWGNVALIWKFGKWHCSVTVPGYSTPYHMHPEIGGNAHTPSAAIDACFAALEEWQSSGKMDEARAKAVKDYTFYSNRYNQASSWERSGLNAIRKPPPLEPKRPFTRSD